jgi:hypothetical protein
MSHDLDHIDPFIEHSESFVPSFLRVSTTHVFAFANRMIFLIFLICCYCHRCGFYRLVGQSDRMGHI